MKSENITELAKALALAQGQMKGAAKDSANPFYKSKYADLASVWHAIGKPFADNGLSVTQTLNTVADKLHLDTMLMHMSGQWISSSVEVVLTKKDPQGIGSALTYFRRYALSAIAGVYSEDDDGNATSARSEHKYDPKQHFDPLPDEEMPEFDNFPDGPPVRTQDHVDRVFTIGKEMKGQKFSDMVRKPDFVNWVKSEHDHNLAKCHTELKEFYQYAKVKGVIK